MQRSQQVTTGLNVSQVTRRLERQASPLMP
jgi:hypothetical protein